AGAAPRGGSGSESRECGRLAGAIQGGRREPVGWRGGPVRRSGGVGPPSLARRSQSGAASEWVAEPTAPGGPSTTGPDRLALRSFAESSRLSPLGRGGAAHDARGLAG